MGRRGRKKRPNAKEIRAKAARVDYWTKKLTKEVLHDSIEELKYEISFDAAVDEILGTITDELSTEVLVEARYSMGSTITAKNNRRPASKSSKSSKTVQKNTIKPKIKSKTVKLNPVKPQAVQAPRIGNNEYELEYLAWMDGKRRNLKLTDTRNLIGCYICNLFDKVRNIGIAVEYLPEPVDKYVIVYDDRTRNQVPREIMSELAIQDAAVEESVRMKLEEYRSNGKYKLFPIFPDTPIYRWSW